MSEKSNKQREISRREAMRVARDKLDSLYRRSSASGYIAIDVQSGKAIWVKTFLCKVKAEGRVDAHDVFADLERELIRFEAENLSGRVHLIVYRGRPVQVESVVEDDKVRVG